jgi:hypothetical protein
MAHRPETLHAAQVMDTVHQQDPTHPCRRTETSISVPTQACHPAHYSTQNDGDVRSF